MNTSAGQSRLRDLRGRVQIVLLRLLDCPHIALVAVAAPMARRALGPSVQDRLVLALVVGTAQREGILRPDDEGRPFATGGAERGLQHIEFAGRHRHVDATAAMCHRGRQRRQQEVVEAIAQVVVQDRAILAAHLVLGAVGVVHVVRRVGENHVRCVALHQPVIAFRRRWRHRTADGALPMHPDVARAGRSASRRLPAPHPHRSGLRCPVRRPRSVRPAHRRRSR
jgi:hypothetical protein